MPGAVVISDARFSESLIPELQKIGFTGVIALVDIEGLEELRKDFPQTAGHTNLRLLSDITMNPQDKERTELILKGIVEESLTHIHGTWVKKLDVSSIGGIARVEGKISDPRIKIPRPTE